MVPAGISDPSRQESATQCSGSDRRGHGALARRYFRSGLSRVSGVNRSRPLCIERVIRDDKEDQFSRYLKRREVRQRELAAAMSAPRLPAKAVRSPNRHQNVTAGLRETAEEELSASIAPELRASGRD